MTFYSLVYQWGGSLFDEEGTKATFNSDEAVEACTWLVDMVEQGHSPANVGQDADYLAFKSNKNAFNWNGIWQINDLKKSPEIEWGVAPLPQIGSKPAAWANSHNFTIVKQRRADANKVAASKVFINWLSEHSLDWAAGGQVPARKQVREDAGFKSLTEVASLAPRAGVRGVPAGGTRPGRSGHDLLHRIQRGRAGQEGAEAGAGRRSCQGQQAAREQPQEVRELIFLGDERGAAAAADAPALAPARWAGGLVGLGQAGHPVRLPRAVPGALRAFWPVADPARCLAQRAPVGLLSCPNRPFIGLDNYKDLFSSDSAVFGDWWQSVRATAIFTMLSVPLLVVIPLGLALLLNRSFPGRTFFRALYFAPYVLGVAVIGVLWRFLLDANLGW